MNIILRELFVADSPICLVILITLPRRWRKKLIIIVNLAEVLSVLENDFPKWIHNIIVNIYDVALKDKTMFTPYSLVQIKPQIFL